MPPRRGESIERTDEHDEFIEKVRKYHDERGTHLDTEPKVGVRHIDLRKLYDRVVSEGGYDLCSDTKAKPLMWRKLAEEFVGKNVYTAAQAFQIKNVYYKNLCAYEIKHHWEQEPPPKEILEEVTAKGGNVMTRTLENFEPPAKREERNLQGEDSDGGDSDGEQKGSKDDKPDEELGSGTGRSTRGLRQQPPQRVLFQPDLSSSRQTRVATQISHGSPVPAPTSNGVMDASFLMNGASSTLASYEPSQSYPLSLRPVITPGNNPDFYKNERKRKLEARAGPLATKYRNVMLPGTGFIGPNIYVRAQLALQSGITEEEQYALHHLVKISHERGDKYRFDQFPGLGEALVKKALQVSGLFYDVDWEVSYDDETMNRDNETLNGLRGTSDVIEKLRSRVPLVTNDSMQDANFHSQVTRITEAALIIRNMCLLDENAHYMAKLPLMRDYLSVVLNLPQHSSISELQHYALETSEQVLKYCDIGANDALYHSLLFQLDRRDRGAITLALRVISRIAMHFDTPKRLDDIPDHILQNVQDWLMIEDEELRSACLDFLMQYTSFADNVDNLLQILDVETLAQRLSRLLLFAAREQKQQQATSVPAAEEPTTLVPSLSRSVIEGLLKLEEPERSSEWLRMCFLGEPNSEMTQISLWQAYQSTFNPFQSTHQHLAAGDFIKNVSSTFTGATAQVAGANKYVIRGIRARSTPVEKGKELLKCRWKYIPPFAEQRHPVTGLLPPSPDMECTEWFRNSDDMLKHILTSHLQIPMRRPITGGGDRMDIDGVTNMNGSGGRENGSKTLRDTFDLTAVEASGLRCRWAGCHRFSNDDLASGRASRIALFARHIYTHLPEMDATKTQHIVDSASRASPALVTERTTFTTLSDDRGDAAGVPLGAALVLRNIAKFMPRLRDSDGGVPGQPNGSDMIGIMTAEKDSAPQAESQMWEVFDEEVMERLFYAGANNRTISSYVGSILRSVQAGGG